LEPHLIQLQFFVNAEACRFQGRHHSVFDFSHFI
jgi:hypothetical protein